MLEGKRFSFDEESKALYDAVAPTHSESEFEAVLPELESRLPGQVLSANASTAFRSRFVVPRDRLDATFKAAIDACRSRTLAHLSLPADESFTVEYVTEQELGGLQLVPGQLSQPHPGEHRSADFRRPGDRPRVPRGISGPSRLQRAAREDAGSRPRLGRVLGVPAALAAVAHRRGHRPTTASTWRFRAPSGCNSSATVIFPAAGLDPSGVERYYEVLALVDRLSYAGNEAARRYLNGQIDAAAAATVARAVRALLAAARAAARPVHRPVPAAT